MTGVQTCALPISLYPCPEELDNATSPNKKGEEETEEQYEQRMNDLKRKYGHTNWYDWKIARWGTKWGNCDVYHLTDDTIGFTSAWSPPTQWVEAISSQYPDLEFRLYYLESGMGFCGVFEGNFENGFYDEEGEMLTIDEDGILVEYDAGHVSPEENKQIIQEMKDMDFSKDLILYAVLQKYDTPNKNGRIYPEALSFIL